MNSAAELRRFVLALVGFAFWSSVAAAPSVAQRPNASPPIVCEDYPAQTETPYVLPYEAGKQFAVIRTTSHYTPGNGGVGLYALDFRMPIGTPVVAARGGTVAAIQEGFADGNNEDLRENYVFVKHDDGTIGRYFHLTQNGALVEEGRSVRQGEVIGRSGNSGQSGEPHLHFDVQKCGLNLPPDYNQLPCGQTLPVTFRNTRPHACGLKSGETYTALPLPPT